LRRSTKRRPSKGIHEVDADAVGAAVATVMTTTAGAKGLKLLLSLVTKRRQSSTAPTMRTICTQHLVEAPVTGTRFRAGPRR